MFYFYFFFFFFNDTATTEIYTLSLHDALPISTHAARASLALGGHPAGLDWLLRVRRSEEHTSELQSRLHLVCRLLLEKKKKKNIQLIKLTTYNIKQLCILLQQPILYIIIEYST